MKKRAKHPLHKKINAEKNNNSPDAGKVFINKKNCIKKCDFEETEVNFYDNRQNSTYSYCYRRS